MVRFNPSLPILSLLLAGSLAIAPLAQPALALDDPAATPTVVFPMPSAVTDSTTVRIGGSQLMSPINQALKQQFEEQFPGTQVQLEDEGDTATALEALITGNLDLAAIGRPLSDPEKAQGLREIPVSFDKIAILVGRDNPFEGSLTLEQLAQIFRGEITDWAELGREPGPMQIVDRPPNSETRLALSRYGLLPEEDVAPANRVAMATDDTAEVIRALGRDGIGFAIANQVRQQQAAKLVKIAILQTTLPGDALYPYSQVRGYAYKDETDPEVRSFLGFTSTELGREAIATARQEEAASLITLPAIPPVAELPPEGEEMGDRPASETPATFSFKDVPLWVWLLIPLFPLLVFVPILWKRSRSKKQTPPPRSPQPTPTEESDILTAWIEETPQAIAAAEPQPAAAAADRSEPELPSDEARPAAAPTHPPEAPESETSSFTADLLDSELPLDEMPTVEELPTLSQDKESDIPLVDADSSDIDLPLDEMPTVEELPTSSQETESDIPPVVADSSDIDLPLDEMPTVEELPTPSQETESDIPPVVADSSDIDLPLDEMPTVEELPASSQDTESDTSRFTADLPDPAWLLAEFPSEEESAVLGEDVAATELADTALVVAETPTFEEPELASAETSEAALPAAEPLDTAAPLAETHPDPESEAADIEPLSSADSGNMGQPLAADGGIEQPAISPDLDPAAAIANIPAAPQPATTQAAVGAIASLTHSDGITLSVEALQQAVVQQLRVYGKTPQGATPNEAYLALATVICQHLMQQRTPETTLTHGDGRLVAELAAEYRPGPHLKQALVYRESLEAAHQAMQAVGLDLAVLLEQEEEPGLGCGELGRLMMCYLDALATQNMPAIGYGIRYEYGIFDQEIRDGWQVEVPDNWLLYGNPWEVERPDRTLEVCFGGYTESFTEEQTGYQVRWVPAETVQAQCFDTPVPGYGTDTVNLLRLWRANTEDSLCQVLYPVDGADGQRLRLRQQVFLVSCTVQDLLRLHQQSGQPWETLPERIALHLNDTDTLLAIAELMRLLVDHQRIDWEPAWDLTCRSLTYTSHSLRPAAWDQGWPVALLEAELPRHLEIIYEINARFLDGLRSQSYDLGAIQRMSLIDETGDRRLRLTHLACIGTHGLNGVSQLHTQLLEQRLLPDFYALTPERFCTHTNGISQRRFLAVSHPRLADLITQTIGNKWIHDLHWINRLENWLEDDNFCAQWVQVKQAAKQDLAGYIQERLGETVDPHSLFDGQITVIHESKRQILNLLHSLTLYHRLKTNPNREDWVPRTVLLSGKASPDSDSAKRVIKLIHAVAERVNADPDVAGRLKVIFLPDYTQKLVEIVYPALDLSEHLSLAGTEASDTGAMMAALNAALLIGTPDGSNPEIRVAVGSKNFFLFGLTQPEVQTLQTAGYRPWELYEQNPELKAAIDALVDGSLTPYDPELFRPVVNQLLSQDPDRILADYASYMAAQETVSQHFRQSRLWVQQSIRTVARMGQFSSDRAIQGYRQTLWTQQPPFG